MGQPKYREIASSIRKKILNGDLRPGDEVPSERALASEYAVARPTATKALQVLRDEGVVTSRLGSGTYVADLQLNHRASARYQHAIASGKVYSGNEVAEITFAGIDKAVPEVVSHLVGNPAIRRDRIIRENDTTKELSSSWFPLELHDVAPALAEPRKIRNGTTRYIEERTGRRPETAQDRILARMATADEALQFGVPANSPVLTVLHLVFNDHDKVTECVLSVYPPDRWAFEQRYPLS